MWSTLNLAMQKSSTRVDCCLEGNGRFQEIMISTFSVPWQWQAPDWALAVKAEEAEDSVLVR